MDRDIVSNLDSSPMVEFDTPPVDNFAAWWDGDKERDILFGVDFSSIARDRRDVFVNELGNS
jgi:hypothetical protein